MESLIPIFVEKKNRKSHSRLFFKIRGPIPIPIPMPMPMLMPMPMPALTISQCRCRFRILKKIRCQRKHQGPKLKYFCKKKKKKKNRNTSAAKKFGPKYKKPEIFRTKNNEVKIARKNQFKVSKYIGGINKKLYGLHFYKNPGTFSSVLKT